MNKSHRIVWSEARQGFVVAHENAASSGKPSSKRKALGFAVTAALMSLGSQVVLAGSCTTPGPGTSVISGAETLLCMLSDGESVTITGTGIISIPYSGQPGVLVLSGGNIRNAGSISATTGNSGIEFSGSTGTLTGGIFNETSTSLISGRNGVNIYNGVTVTGSVVNDGKIFGNAYSGIVLSYNSFLGGITNAGTIQGTNAGIPVVKSKVANGISNSGLIQGLGANISAAGIYLASAGTVSGGITNSGLIDGGVSTSGILLGAWNPTGSVIDGGIHNDSTGTISGGTRSILVKAGTTINGGIVNLGHINGGIGNLGSISGISNSGTIIGGGNPIASGAAATLPSIVNQSGGLIDGVLDIQSTTNVTNAGTIALPANTTSTIAGAYTQSSGTVAGTLRTRLNASAQFGSVSVGGAVTLATNAVFDVLGDTTTCGNIATGGTLAGVISGTTISGFSAGTTLTGATVNDNCAAVDFRAVSTGTAINLVAITPPVTWPVAGASNGNGTVSCVTPVLNNATATCTGTASGGYYLASAAGSSSVCGTVSVTGSTITAGPVTAACTVTGTFAASPPVTSQGSIPTIVNGVSASMSVSGCTSISTAAFAAPTSGAPSNTTFPFGMLGFTLNGCISGPVTVTVTYAQPLPSGATFYKNINGTYSAYPATLGANTVTFSLTDGGSGDADGVVNGSIRDPGGIGVSSSAAPIPTLSEWGLIFLSSLMAMFGIQHSRRRKGGQT